MDKKKLAYWVVTVVLFIGLIGSGVMNLLRPDELVANYVNLGYPLYVMTIIGIFKLGGAATIIAPNLLRLKEWAYAGVMIDMVGAVWSHTANGDPVGQAVPAAVILIISMTSWALRPASRKLAGPTL